MKAAASRFYGWPLVGVLFLLYLINSTFPYYGARVINTHMAIALSSTGIGALVSTPLMNRVIVAFGGNWRNGWRLVVGAALISSLLAAIVGKRESTHQTKRIEP